MLWAICAGIVITALGGLMFWKPDLVWKLREQWKSYYADGPSDFYVAITRIGGIVFAVVGIAVVILPFILK